MSNKISTIKERILHSLEIKGIVKSKFFEKIGMTYGNFTGISKKTPLNSDAIGNILLEIPDINLEWLLTGKGNMLRDNGNTDVKQPEPANDTSLIDKITQQAEQIGQLKNENKHQNEQIRKLSSENERLKNELEKLQPKRKELQDSVIEHDSQIFDMSKLSPFSAPLAAEPPTTHRWRPENDINAEQNIPKI